MAGAGKKGREKGLWVSKKERMGPRAVVKRKPIHNPKSFLKVIVCMFTFDALYSCAFPHSLTGSYLLKLKERGNRKIKNILTFTIYILR